MSDPRGIVSHRRGSVSKRRVSVSEWIAFNAILSGSKYLFVSLQPIFSSPHADRQANTVVYPCEKLATLSPAISARRVCSSGPPLLVTLSAQANMADCSDLSSDVELRLDSNDEVSESALECKLSDGSGTLSEMALCDASPNATDSEASLSEASLSDGSGNLRDMVMSDASPNASDSVASLAIMPDDGAASDLSETSDLLTGNLEPQAVDPLQVVTHEFLGPGYPLEKQAQLLIANVVASLSGAPRKFLSSMAEVFLSVKDQLAYGGKGLLWKLGSKLLGVTVYRVQSCHKTMQANLWRPVSPRPWRLDQRTGEIASNAEEHPVGVSTGPTEDVDRTLLTVVRTAVASVVEGNSFLAYERQLQRLRLSDATIGTKYCDRRFVTEVISLSSLVLRQLDAYDYSHSLPGLGIPSDFAILADPVSIGMEVRAKHDVLLVMCLSLVSRHTGTIYCPMFAAPPMPFGSHSGNAMAELMLQTLADHPCGWGLQVLRSRCSALCGDGALCIGGPEHRHKSSDAVGKMWTMVHSDAAVVAYPDQRTAEIPQCCVWDPFHRADNAGWRAIRAVPLATLVFDISKQLDSLFAQSEGVLLFRGVAKYLDETPHAIRAPGGTRKIAYLSGTPSSIVENYRIILAALHGRVAWVKAGHRNQSITSLEELGQTLSDPKFVSFTLLLSDILTMVVRPFAKQMQAALEPAVFQNATHTLRKMILDSLLLVAQFRKLLRVVCLCRQHAPVQDLRCMVEAFLSKRGQKFAVFADHILGIVCPEAPVGGDDTAAPLFRNTRLAIPPQVKDRSQTMCLGPHCQCSAKIAYHRKLWTDACEGRAQPHVNLSRPKVQVRVRGSSQELRVPVPVAYPQAQVRPSEFPIEAIPARISFLPRAVPPVPNLDLTGMLRARHFTPQGHVSRCQVPHSTYLVHDAVDEALNSASDLLKRLHAEFDKILHSVGCNNDMSALLRDSAVCWDWSFLARHPPTAAHIRAFRSVIETLRPLLIHTLYPEGAEFGGVSPNWPETDTLCGQYPVLTRRVRRAASGAKDVPREVRQAAADWAEAKGYEIRPLWVNCFVEQVCRHCCPGLAAVHHLRTAFAISCFAGLVPTEAYTVQSLPCARLLNLKGKSRRQSKRARSLHGKPALLPGHVAACMINKKRMLVYIQARILSVNVSKVASALDSFPWFSIGTRNSWLSSAWHAARVHHRCRLLFPPDAPCERMGSFMRLAWDQRQGRASPAYVSDRLYLMQAGVACLGNERDEMILKETCRLFASTSKYRMSSDATLSRSKNTPIQPPFVSGKERAMVASGRFAGALPAQEAAMVLEPQDLADLRGQGQAKRKQYLLNRARSARPTHLPEAIHKAVDAASTAKNNVVLPFRKTLASEQGAEKASVAASSASGQHTTVSVS